MAPPPSIKQRDGVVDVTGHEKWPMDFSSCDFGQIIPNSVIEEYYGVKEEDEDFKFKQIRFMQLLDAELKARDMYATICIREGQIKILTHEEASEYNRKRFNCHVAGLARTHEKNMHVAANELEEETREEHNRTVMFQSKVLQAVLRTKAEFRLEATARKTPGLITLKRK